MATTADRINVELRANLAGLPRDLANAAGQFERYEKRVVQSARTSADAQVREAKRGALVGAQMAARTGRTNDLRPPAGSALATISAMVDYKALVQPALSNLQPAPVARGQGVQVAGGPVVPILVSIGAGMVTNELSNALKDNGTSKADESYQQVQKRLGASREEAADLIQSLSKAELEQEQINLNNAVGLQEKELAAVRERFLSTFELTIGEMRDAVAFGLNGRSDEIAKQYYNQSLRTVQSIDNLRDNKTTIADVAESLSLQTHMSPDLQQEISNDSYSERSMVRNLGYLNDLSSLIVARLGEIERASEGLGDALGNATEEAKALGAAAAQPSSSIATDETKLLSGAIVQPSSSIATDDAKLLGGAIAQPSSSIGGFLTPVDIDEARIGQTPGVSSGSLGCLPTIETHRPAQAGLGAVRTKADEQNKKADEDAAARQKELAAAITAVGDVFTNGIKGAKDFNDALDSIGLGLLDLTAKGLFGQGALGGVFNQLLGAGSGGAGLLSLLAGSSDGSSGGGVFSGIGSLFGSLFGGIFGRASGGQVLPGQLYEVGEAGREWFAPSVPGQVIPNHVIKAAAGGDGGSSQPITFNISMAGANGDRTIAAIAAAAVRNGLAGVPEINRQHRIRFA